MIWATVSSRFCFCWLYRASLSLTAENIVNLISVLTIWWCPCVESSLVLLEEGVCCDQCILLTKLLAFALLHFVLQGQTFLLLQVFLDFLPLHSSSLWWKEHQGFPDSSVDKGAACSAGDPCLIPGSGRSVGVGVGYSLQYSWASLVAQLVKNLLAMQETWVWSLG